MRRSECRYGCKSLITIHKQRLSERVGWRSTCMERIIRTTSRGGGLRIAFLPEYRRVLPVGSSTSRSRLVGKCCTEGDYKEKYTRPILRAHAQVFLICCHSYLPPRLLELGRRVNVFIFSGIGSSFNIISELDILDQVAVIYTSQFPLKHQSVSERRTSISQFNI